MGLTNAYDSPEESGNYFAWGEKQTNSDCKMASSITYGRNVSVLNKMGCVDDKLNLLPDYDVATILQGSNYRMPTKAEFKELIEKCNWIYSSINKTNGYFVVGPNGNNIFLPAAGYQNGSFVCRIGWWGFYWSSTAFEEDCECSSDLYFNREEIIAGEFRRFFGCCIRPVTSSVIKKKNEGLLKCFIAGSTMLKLERNAFHAAVSHVNSKHKRISLESYDFKSFPNGYEGNQNVYNRFIGEDVDFIVFVITGEIGCATKEELEYATESCDKTGAPRIVVYVQEDAYDGDWGEGVKEFLREKKTYVVKYKDLEQLQVKIQTDLLEFVLDK